MNVVILVDYDNLNLSQKASGMHDLVAKVLMQLLIDPETTKGTCELRVYGGWYEGNLMTRTAQELAVSLQNEFPVLIRLPTSPVNRAIFTAKATLATALIEDPGRDIVNTFRRKGRPSNIRIQKQEDAGCTSEGCILPTLKKFLSSGRCPVSTCGRVDLIYRNEQKIVDSMLTCDLIYAPQHGFDHIILVSSDTDFTPPLHTLLLRNIKVTRVHPKFSNQREEINIHSKRLVELEL